MTQKSGKFYTTLTLTHKQVKTIKLNIQKLSDMYHKILDKNEELQEQFIVLPETILMQTVCEIGKIPHIIPQLLFCKYISDVGANVITYNQMNDYESFIYIQDVVSIIHTLQGMLNSKKNKISSFITKCVVTVNNLASILNSFKN